MRRSYRRKSRRRSRRRSYGKRRSRRRSRFGKHNYKEEWLHTPNPGKHLRGIQKEQDFKERIEKLLNKAMNTRNFCENLQLYLARFPYHHEVILEHCKEDLQNKLKKEDPDIEFDFIKF